MLLKDYQREVIKDLEDFLNLLEETQNLKKAFAQFWETRENPVVLTASHRYFKPYDNTITGVPRVTAKVPTAGGKTFIACNALRTIFRHRPPVLPKVVAWLVPGDTILKQTLKNLRDPGHPYHQTIASHFGNRVTVYEKQDLLMGNNFNPTRVREQLSIFVLSISSFSSRKKEDRKAFEENPQLEPFISHYQDREKLLEGVPENALMQVINQLNPVVIVDESHNTESELRLEMLKNLNPSFIFDLTATPRNHSNILSFVDASKLKRNNMVKLPVIVYNHPNVNRVIAESKAFRDSLEEMAERERAASGNYIRPMVLFQAQPKRGEENVTFKKVKENLIKAGIPEEEIRIKTAEKDELKDEDLMSPDCKVRYIITVNALKEGWGRALCLHLGLAGQQKFGGGRGADTGPCAAAALRGATRGRFAELQLRLYGQRGIFENGGQNH